MADEAEERTSLGDARPIAEDCLAYLRGGEAVKRCKVVGSIRRWRETVGNVDVLAAGSDADAITERLASWPSVSRVVESSTTRTKVRAEGVSVDLRIVPPAEWGSALQYFTGSKAHNRELRRRASERGRGNPDDATARTIQPEAATEGEAYGSLGLDPIAPELRQGDGEIEAAAEGALPRLVEEDDVRGDLHVHTRWSDGALSIEEMIEEAAEFGHEYVCITDHASGTGMVGGMGLSDDEIREQMDVIREAAEDVGIEVFCGIEANIGVEGEIAIDDRILADLDLVIASPHLLSRSRVRRAVDSLDSRNDGDGSSEGGLDGTDRIVEAISHPHVDIIGHPTGRHLDRRAGLDLDIGTVAEAAAEHGVALEVNGNPARLDLRDDAVRRAIERGAKIAIDTDAHDSTEYARLDYGVHTARRGWAEPDDVINALDTDDLRRFLA